MTFPKSLTISSPVKGIVNHWSAREVPLSSYVNEPVGRVRGGSQPHSMRDGEGG